MNSGVSALNRFGTEAPRVGIANEPTEGNRTQLRKAGVEHIRFSSSPDGVGSATSRTLLQALDQITPVEIANLVSFAEKQLRRVGLASAAAEDLVQDVFCGLLIGTSSQSRGRHPRESDLRGHQEFLFYIKGAIGSLVSCQRRRLQGRFQHTPWDEFLCETVPLDSGAAGCSVFDDAAFSDLAETLFFRLKSQVPPRLEKLLTDWWSQRFESDNIPIQGAHRRLRSELRAFATKAISELI